MAENSGFFDAHLVNGEYDRVYLAESFAKYFASFIGNGVFGGKSNELMVQQKSTADMSIRVLSGQAWINGYWYENSDEFSLSIDVADGVLNRIDLIVLRWDNYERVIRLAVKKGTPATNAAVPQLQRDGDYYELMLAKVYIKAGATSIIQADITDTRLDYSLCGLVQGVVQQFDTTEFGIQLDSFIENFEASNAKKMNEVLARLNEMAETNDIASLILDVEEMQGRFIGDNEDILSIENGGTGANMPEQARENLGVESKEQTLVFHANKQTGSGLLDGSTNFNSITEPGIYWCNTWVNDGGTNRPNKRDTGWMIVYSNASKCMIQHYYSGSGVILNRAKDDEKDEFGEWEFVNPPMVPGVEYRTTERWNGKPVYAITIHAASLPNKSLLMIDTNVVMDKIVSIDGFATNSNNDHFPFPVIQNTGVVPTAGISNVVASEGFFMVYTTTDMTSYQAYFTIKYTKA